MMLGEILRLATLAQDFGCGLPLGCASLTPAKRLNFTRNGPLWKSVDESTTILSRRRTLLYSNSFFHKGIRFSVEPILTIC